MKYKLTFNVRELETGSIFEKRGACPFGDPELFVLNEIKQNNISDYWVSISPLSDVWTNIYMSEGDFIKNYVLAFLD